MKFSVSDQVLKETTNCEYDFLCLELGQCRDKPLCEVDYAIGQKFTFLKTKDSFNCLYLLPFGQRQICRCPTRFVIQKKYGE